jgi:prolyl-tRNA synthetase
MRQTQLFTKTRKEAPKDEVAKNAQLLIRAGYIHKEMAGAYDYLPLGRMTLDRVVNIIRREMESLGANEVSMTAFQSPELWKQTGRWDDSVVDAWFKTKLAAGGEVGLGVTHEEPMAAMMRDHVSSYRDLPRAVFQFQTKFRNELRAKSGIMRGREFMMKDLYSFNVDEAAHKDFYERAAAAYARVFETVGLGDRTYRTFASGGIFSEFSDEFQVACDAGEDTTYLAKDKGIAVNEEVMTDENLSKLGVTRDELVAVKTVEVGNIFSLGTKFSEPLGLLFQAEDGERRPVIMGSYGIGPGRLMGTIIECLADDKGIVWPESVAPFVAHLLLVGRSDEAKAKADALYEELRSKGVDVIYDDRDPEKTRAGEKFADADLMGMPWQIVIGDREVDGVEAKDRRTGEAKVISRDELVSSLVAIKR